MDTDFLEAAFRLRDLANRALDADRATEWLSLMEMAFTSAAATGAEVPLSVKFQPRPLLPAPIGAIQHLIAHISGRGIVLHAAVDLLAHPVSDLRRLPLAGALLSRIARQVGDDGPFQLILDIGDGDDAGAYPRLSFSSARPDALLVPDPYFFFNENNDYYRAYAAQAAKPWSQRRDAPFWRGGAGGARLSAPDPRNPRDWSCQQRLHLCQAVRDSSALRGRLDVGLTNTKSIDEPYLRESLAAEGFFKPEVPKLEFFEYRHLFDVDGWSNAWSLLDKMIGGAAILKVASGRNCRQWFYDRLEPWRNYVPLAADLSDFEEIVAWVLAHPAECEAIATAAARTADEIQLLPDLDFAARAAQALLWPIERA